MREFGELKLWGYIMSKIKLTLLASGLILSLGMQPTSKADEENKIYFPGSETDFLKSDDLSWDKIPQHYVPSKGIGDWQKLYSKQFEKHWKEGRSAFELAYSWENANPDLPPEIAALFYGSVELLAATPEHKTPLPGGRAASQSDVLAFIRINDRVCAVAVEGKVKEEFGTQTVGQWFKNPSPGKIERLKYISTTLGLSYPPPDEIRYQLLHRTASAVIEAQHFKTDCAAMIVQSFSPENKWFEDYSAFLGLFGIQSVKQGKLYKTDKPGITLYFGWAGSQKQPVAAVSDTAVAKTTTPSTLTVTQTTDAPISLMELIKTSIIVGIAVIFIIGLFWKLRGRASSTVDKTDTETENERKGRELEEYVEDLLTRSENIDLWKSTKYGFPDFEATITDEHGKEHQFSMECKSIKSFYWGMFRIVAGKYIQKCKEYQKKKDGRPFFLVVGVGEPRNNPRYLYAVPLEKLLGVKLNISQLRPYLLRATGESTYKPISRELKLSR